MEHYLNGGWEGPQGQELMQDTQPSSLLWLVEPDWTSLVGVRASVPPPNGSLPQEEEPMSGSWPLTLPTAWEMPGDPDQYLGWDEYTCPRKLHNYKMQPGDLLSFKFGHIQSKNFCPFCYVEWVNINFPTEMVKAGVDAAPFDEGPPF